MKFQLSSERNQNTEQQHDYCVRYFAYNLGWQQLSTWGSHISAKKMNCLQSNHAVKWLGLSSPLLSVLECRWKYTNCSEIKTQFTYFGLLLLHIRSYILLFEESGTHAYSICKVTDCYLLFASRTGDSGRPWYIIREGEISLACNLWVKPYSWGEPTGGVPHVRTRDLLTLLTCKIWPKLRGKGFQHKAA